MFERVIRIMFQKQGFLIHEQNSGRYFVDYQQTLSIAVNELLLELLLAARPYMRGTLLDVRMWKTTIQIDL